MRFTVAEEEMILSRSGLLNMLGTETINAVKVAYRTGERHYHTWDHALSVVSWVNYAMAKLDLGLGSPGLQIAALFHDAVYDTAAGSPVNEAASADLCQELCQKTFHAKRVWDDDGMIRALIMDTAKHGVLERSNTIQRSAILLDADLASFGESRWEVVQWNDQNIVKELTACGKYTAEQICLGRIKFLTGLLQKNSIFLTELFQDMFELQARRNILRVINTLEAKW